MPRACAELTADPCLAASQHPWTQGRAGFLAPVGRVKKARYGFIRIDVKEED